MLQNKHVLAARFTLASIWFDQEPAFDLTKCAFLVSLFVFKRDDLPKFLDRTAKECNKVTLGWCSSIVNSLGSKRLSAVWEQTRSKTAWIIFFGSRSILRAAKTENLVPRCSAPRVFFAPKPHASYAGYIVNNAVCLLDVRVIRATEGIFIWEARVTRRLGSLQQQHQAGRRWLSARDVDWSFMRSYDRRAKHSSGSVQQHQTGKENTKDLRSLHRRRSFGSSRSLAWASGLPKGLGERRF